ncbi:MAG TPA: sigma 54-interacting transcriptional regulator [Zoogloea sp.]|nr:sigma 54-interacting transcriptional regulator [Zoogloea sp.]
MPSDSFAAEAHRIRQRVMDTLLSAFSELSEGLLIVDRDARIVWMNEQYPRHLGFSDPAEAIGKPVEDVIPNSQMRSVVTSGRPIMLDIMEFGSESFVVMRLPVRDETGEIIGGFGVVVFDDPRQLAPIVSRFQNLRHELADTRRKLDEARRTKYTFASFVGASPACLKVKDQARRAARSSSPVLIIGETGTGKELLAQAIHSASPRAASPFVAVNIAAIPETLLESEFFGVAPGAYTGADRKGRSGKFELAHGGTLFLDEIGDMSPALQAKLLRVLQEKEIEAVGSNRLISVDVRIIAATSRKLQEEVEAGRFRADLFYRLNVMTLDVPPLRARLDDLPIIAESLADSIARRLGEPPRSMAPGALAYLARHSWPGNVRELSNVIERALLMSDADTLEQDDFAPILPGLEAKPRTPPGARSRTLESVQQDAEREAIVAAIAAASGNKAQAARNLGISRASLYEKIGALGIGSDKH